MKATNTILMLIEKHGALSIKQLQEKSGFSKRAIRYGVDSCLKKTPPLLRKSPNLDDLRSSYFILFVPNEDIASFDAMKKITSQGVHQ